jgi:hypothetical protein
VVAIDDVAGVDEAVGTIGAELVVGKDCGVDDATGSMITVRVEVRPAPSRSIQDRC